VHRGRLGYQRVNHLQELAAPAKPVERAHFDQAFQRTLVDLAQINPVTEFLQAGKGSPLRPRVQNGLHRAFAHVLDCRHAKADGAARRNREVKRQPTIANGRRRRVGGPLLDLEIQPAVVHIRRQHVNPHAPAFLDEVDDLLGLVALHKQQRRHVLDRVVRLQIGRLYRDDRVVGGMALVKAVAGEKLDVPVDRFCRIFRDIVLLASLNKEMLVLLDIRCFLLADGAAHQVGFAGGVAGKLAQDLDDLLLVDDDAVGLRQDRRQRRVLVLRLLLAVHAPDELRNVLHRPRAVQRDSGDDMLERIRPHLREYATHALTFDLEDPAHLTAGKQAEGIDRSLSLKRDRRQAKLLAVPLADQP